MNTPPPADTASTDQTFLADFHQVAAIGATAAGGVDRQAGTEEDREMRQWFCEFAARRGWETRSDGIGNLFALVELVPGAPYVMIGSHLDSQPLGGRFDGAYGVIAALHAADRYQRQVRESAVPVAPEYNIAVVDWFNEEGGRFAPSIMGSSVFAGLMDQEQMLDVEDLAGVSVREAMTSIGALGTDPRPEVAAYAEIHIEQGRILEREGVDLGAVDFSWHTQKLDIEVIGEQSHTGATAMADRRDALVAASEVILLVHRVTEVAEPESLVSSVGRMTVEPNSPIVVPRRVHLVADLRAERKSDVLAARDRLRREIAEVAARYDVRIEVTDVDIRERQFYPVEGIELAEKCAADAGLSVRRLRTMAGHDSVAMNRIVPTVMLFIPSADGVSHCEREFTSDADMVSGVHALTAVVARLAGGELDGVAAGMRR
ncbi:M20 family metallo-hydrolase [Tsukamurella serpentis]